MTIEERVRVTEALWAAGREAALVGLRMRHPEASEAEMRVRLMVRLYGRREAVRVFGEVPDDAV